VSSLDASCCGHVQPLVIAIDVEPDLRRPDPATARPWHGFEALVPFLDSWRPRLSAAAGRPCRFAWLVAVSPQTEAIHGDAAWALLRYSDLFARCLAAGDEIGLHVHFWRPAPELPGGWQVDLQDGPWMENALRQAFRRFENIFGRPCRIFRFGDGWLDGWALDLVAELGIEIDLTLEPGWPARDGLAEDEPHRGGLPDTRGLPVAPYRRGASDFRRPAEAGGRGPWMLPVATGRLGEDGAGRFSQLLWGLPPADIVPLLDRVLEDAARPIVVSVMRSDVGADQGLRDHLDRSLAHLAARPDLARHPVMTPSEAMRALGCELRFG
jgi:hypothetical protein